MIRHILHSGIAAIALVVTVGGSGCLYPASRVLSDRGREYTARGVTAIVATDLNGDGKNDLAMASPRAGGSIAVRFGNGDGTFGDARDVITARGPVDLVAGDIDGDGKTDLVVASRGAAELSAGLADGGVEVLWGRGDGTFKAGTKMEALIGPIRVALADFNGDGKPDIAATGGGRDGRVAVILNAGGGTFLQARLYSAGAAPGGIAGADADGDGVADVLVADQGDSSAGVATGVMLLHGNGDGTFRSGKFIETGYPAQAVAVADLDGDGVGDLIVGQLGGLAVLRGLGKGSFAAPVDYDAYTNPESITVVDVDGDGKLDVVTTRSLWRGNGKGGFARAEMWAPTSNTSAGSTDVTVADLDGDGTLDAVLANAGSNNIAVHLGRAQTRTGARPQQQAPAAPSAPVDDATQEPGAPRG